MEEIELARQGTTIVCHDRILGSTMQNVEKSMHEERVRSSAVD